MKTVLDLYNESETYTPYDHFIGRKVRVVEYVDGKEQWSSTVHVIENFDPDACGQGCCHAFQVSGKDTSYWSGQLQVLSE